IDHTDATGHSDGSQNRVHGIAVWVHERLAFQLDQQAKGPSRGDQVLVLSTSTYPTTSFSAPASPAASSALSPTTSRPPPSSGTRMTIPRPSLVTSIGPSPVRGFIAAIEIGRARG